MAGAEPDSGNTAGGDGDDAYLAAVGGLVAAAGERAGMSQEALDHAAGLEPSTLGLVENGELVFVSDLRAVARTLRLRVCDLLPDEPAAGEEPAAAHWRGQQPA